jgi:hypothetical protein
MATPSIHQFFGVRGIASCANFSKVKKSFHATENGVKVWALISENVLFLPLLGLWFFR